MITNGYKCFLTESIFPFDENLQQENQETDDTSCF